MDNNINVNKLIEMKETVNKIRNSDEIKELLKLTNIVMDSSWHFKCTRLPCGTIFFYTDSKLTSDFNIRLTEEDVYLQILAYLIIKYHSSLNPDMIQ